jgi:DNA invertase Pin-like site-specific DNA recombinase
MSDKALATKVIVWKEHCAPMSNDTPTEKIPAAQYVRASTEHQQYSTQNQRDVLVVYADKHNYEISTTYADDGKSGLNIAGREALKRMIEDVQSGAAKYRAILVYDISRWGRFQDTDESAYYEYICKRAGISVHYCAEQFENDGSPTATIIKSVKRAMAGEYSRELSAKVHKGQCRLIQLGYRQGGPAGYGLRRMLIDQSGESKGILKIGEHKSLQTDRVILVPGPVEEVAIVRSIYSMFIKDGKREREIATVLQLQQVRSESGRPWSRTMVHEILTNEKYIGNNIYNRISFKLQKRRVVNPPEMWVRKNGAFEPVVDVESFFIARGIIQERHRLFTDDEMVDWLKQLYAEHGRLSACLIDSTDGAPSSSVYKNRFTSLIEAYKLAGYQPNRNYDFLHVNSQLRSLYPNIVDNTVQQLQGIGATVARDDRTDQLLINGEYSAALVLTRCRRTPTGSLRWHITLDQQSVPDITIVVRMDSANEQPADYYLLPMIDITGAKLKLQENNGIYLDTYRFESLQYFVRMAARVEIEVAA